ncbi:MAG: hypothetical protein M3O15_14140, partial [Acidobacteriota bacterium]|nr:hypothetical protein [Acidobacteriota bacterium]
MPEVSHKTLVAYLHQHGDYYTLEALRKSLLGQGFDAAAVEAACQSYLAETSHLKPSKGKEVLRGCVTVVLTVVVLAVLAVGTCVAGYTFDESWSLVLTVSLFLAVLLPIMIIRARRRAYREGGRDEGPAPSLATAPPEERTET